MLDTDKEKAMEEKCKYRNKLMGQEKYVPIKGMLHEKLKESWIRAISRKEHDVDQGTAFM
jgi:hypothetical protein